MLDRRKMKARREAMKLTMEQAATAAGFTHRQQWYMIESGRRADVQLSTLGDIAKALKVKPKELLK